MFRLFGPPGTGKTTTLLNLVDKALAEGTPPHKIAFFAFTRKAASEAKERASVRFGLDPKADLPYFRTIHSLAFFLTGLKSDQLMTAAHYREVENKIGISLVSGETRLHEVEEDLSNSLRKESPILRLITLSRLKKTLLRHEYNFSEIEYNWLEVDYVARSLDQYKKEHNLFDYTDMLELFAKSAHETCPKFELAMIDEAQDLSPLQWDIAHAIEKKSRQMYCAGDDDQAIYKWSGADVDHFINLPGSSEVLEQSYRVPSKIHELANRVCARIVRRFPKNYLPKKEEGSVKRITGFEELNLTEGTWLFLSQAKFHLQGAHNFLKSQGYFYEYSGGKPSVRLKVRQALEAWRLLQAGKPVVFDLVKVLYSYMTGNGVRIARGHKKIIGEEDDTFTFEELRDHHGLLATREMEWHEALDKIPGVDVAYVNALVRRGEDLTKEPRIKLSTIHGAKGGEAENVVLYTDLTVAAEESMERDADSIHRVFYVAVTRSMRNLFIVEPENFNRSYAL
jgi:DNA helicase-2/ATP-dependent DNA helicase PcrA